jgi:hypothetical protein
MLLEAICVVSVVSAFVRQQPFHSGKWRSSYWLIFTQLLFFPAIVAVGVLFPGVSGWPYPKENPMGKRLLDALFYLSLATSALLVVSNERIAMAFRQLTSASASHTRRGRLHRWDEYQRGLAVTAAGRSL